MKTKIINVDIEAYLNANATTIIGEMGKEKGDIFSTHEFIFQLIRDKAREDEYIDWLNGQASKASRFGAVNGLIGKYLSNNRLSLGIQDRGVINDLSIKGYISESHEWEIL
jgi:hypothetical protein